MAAIGLFFASGSPASAQIPLNDDFILAPSAGDTVGAGQVTVAGQFSQGESAAVAVWNKDQRGWLQANNSFSPQFRSFGASAVDENNWSFTRTLPAGSYGVWAVISNQFGDTGRQWRTFEVRPATALPKAPAFCNAEATQDAYRVIWQKASNDSAVRFVVSRSRNGGQFFWAGSFADSPSDTQSAIAKGAVDRNASYRFQVVTVNALGQRSAATTCGSTIETPTLSQLRITKDATGSCFSWKTAGARLELVDTTVAIKRVSNNTWLHAADQTGRGTTTFNAGWRQNAISSVTNDATGVTSTCVNGLKGIGLPAGDYFIGIRTVGDGGVGDGIWRRFTV